MKTIITLVFAIAVGVYGIAGNPFDNGNTPSQDEKPEKAIIIIDTDSPHNYGSGYGYPYYPNNGYGNPYYPPYPNGGNGYGNPYYPPYGNPYYPNTGYGNPYKPNTGNNYYGVNNNTMNQFISALDNQVFDSNKLQIAKSFANTNWLTADQVLRIAQTFTFENNKLEFAKSAYANCLDKGNYFIVTNAFSFSSSTNSLMKFIGKY